MEIWTKRPTTEALNSMCNKSSVSNLGIEFTEVGDGFLKATMPVDSRTIQPFGILNGGASCLLAESLGSVCAHFCNCDNSKTAVGLEINANHIKPVAQGQSVVGISKPIHIGSKTQIWEIKIHDLKNRLICISRLTVALVDKKI